MLPVAAHSKRAFPCIATDRMWVVAKQFGNNHRTSKMHAAAGYSLSTVATTTELHGCVPCQTCYLLRCLARV